MANTQTWLVARVLRADRHTHHVAAVLVDDVPARTTQARVQEALEASGRIFGSDGIPWANMVTRPLKQVKDAEQLDRAERIEWHDLEAADAELLDRRIVVRVSAADHGRMVLAARGAGHSLQEWTLDALRGALGGS